jgi:hypothetical protein
VLRVWNNEVFLNREGVLETILAHAGLPKQNEPSSGASRHLLARGEGVALPPLGEGVDEGDG